MKTLLFSLLLLTGVAVPSFAQQPADQPAAHTAHVQQPIDSLQQRADSLERQAALADSALQATQAETAALRQELNNLRDNAYTDPAYFPVVILIVVFSAVAAMLYLILRFNYRNKERTYQLEKLRIERGDPVVYRPIEPFLRTLQRWLVVAVIAFGLLSIVFMSDHPEKWTILLPWLVTLGACIYLIRKYVSVRQSQLNDEKNSPKQN